MLSHKGIMSDDKPYKATPVKAIGFRPKESDKGPPKKLPTAKPKKYKVMVSSTTPIVTPKKVAINGMAAKYESMAKGDMVTNAANNTINKSGRLVWIFCIEQIKKRVVDCAARTL